MDYGSAAIQILPWPPRHPQADGSYLEQWDLELDDDLPEDVGTEGNELREAALNGLAATLCAQGYPDLVPTEEETSLFRVEVEAMGPGALRLRLRLVDGRANLALGLTAQVWIAIEKRLSRIRSIQGFERTAWRLFLAPPA